MSTIGEIERKTQNRVISLFQSELKYRYLGNWEDRENNSNVEEEILRKWLAKQYSKGIITKVIHEVKSAADDTSKSLYDCNKAFYNLLRYGVNVQVETGKHNLTISIINWDQVWKNDFAIAEEVTVAGIASGGAGHDKRPDIILYVNGIALGVIELKRSTVSITEGIRQNLDNQKHLFIKPFFNTLQLVMAGNDTEGLAYGTIETREKYYLKWKEVNPQKDADFPYLLKITKALRAQAAQCDNLLDRDVVELLNPARFLEILQDFIVFDRGIKKLARHNQYFGVKSAQNFIRRREGGIIWHTQGSGKSLTMVWLSKWLRCFNPNARVLIITDRDELDAQIEKVYLGLNEQIYRTKSGRDMLEKLNNTTPWLLCSLIHKFGRKDKDEPDENDIEKYLADLENSIPKDYKAKGDIYVFVDECHRTQSGKLHAAMEHFVPNALFIGFTGTPILKTDKKTSREIFGRYIHTYKFNEAVKDKVVLDLRYEARDIEQRITSPEKLDDWFETKTKGLTQHAKNELKNRWGTIKKVFSSKSRLEKIVMDIMLDMDKKERLQNGRGNALLISDSIYNACRYYELFQKAGLSQCAIITSYIPTTSDIKGEGDNITEKISRFEIYREMLKNYFNIESDKAIEKVEQFETEIKQKFIDEPAQMKLLIVVNKLLTGFDAPPATFLYIDRHMQDHGLFQAVCRVNRLDGDDKDYGYIVDYMDLFDSLKEAYNDYTTGAFSGFDKKDIEGFMQDMIKAGKVRLDEALEAAKALIEPIHPRDTSNPEGSLHFIHYFCGDTSNPVALQENESKRTTLYKIVNELVRAYANVADDMDKCGYPSKETGKIKADVVWFQKLKSEIELASHDYIDFKQYESSMRQMIDNYIGAEESRVLANFDDMSLVELLAKKGKAALDKLPEDIKGNQDSMAETIENNVRRKIMEKNLENPEYYKKMSELLAEIIRNRKNAAQTYEEYLKNIIELTKKVINPEESGGYPATVNTSAKRALYDTLSQNEDLAIKIDGIIRATKKDGWWTNLQKQRAIKSALYDFLKNETAYDPDEMRDKIYSVAEQQTEYR
ncbi:restriction endonuclease [Spirochaetia bacterium]|nr:restriction endonuclease [Spirochaetia bacterium]